MKDATLDRRDASTIVRLLGVLQTHLESAIETNTVNGKVAACEPYYSKKDLARDRRDWLAAELLVTKLEGIFSKGAISCTLRLMAKSPASKKTTKAAAPKASKKTTAPVSTMPTPAKATAKKKDTKARTAAA